MFKITLLLYERKSSWKIWWQKKIGNMFIDSNGSIWAVYKHHNYLRSYLLGLIIWLQLLLILNHAFWKQNAFHSLCNIWWTLNLLNSLCLHQLIYCPCQIFQLCKNKFASSFSIVVSYFFRFNHLMLLLHFLFSANFC